MKNPIIKKMQLGLVSLSAIALLAACGNDTLEETPTTEDPVENAETPAEDNSTPDTTQGIYGVEFQVTLDQAIETFRETFGEDVNIDEIELDSDFDTYAYRMSGWDTENEYELKIDADTGDVLDEQSEPNDDTEDALNLEGIITPAGAMEIAVTESGSDVVKEWTLEEDDGMTVYEVDIENSDDITLDAATGNVVDR